MSLTLEELTEFANDWMSWTVLDKDNLGAWSTKDKKWHNFTRAKLEQLDQRVADVILFDAKDFDRYGQRHKRLQNSVKMWAHDAHIIWSQEKPFPILSLHSVSMADTGLCNMKIQTYEDITTLESGTTIASSREAIFNFSKPLSFWDNTILNLTKYALVADTLGLTPEQAGEYCHKMLFENGAVISATPICLPNSIELNDI